MAEGSDPIAVPQRPDGEGAGRNLGVAAVADLDGGATGELRPQDRAGMDDQDSRVIEPPGWLVAAFPQSLGAVGAFGSVISILTRLNDFAKKTQSSALLDFMNGFFKPVIGLAAADLFFVLIQSDILPLAFTTTQAATYAYVAIAFVAGFSERLFKDLVSIVERSVGAAGERGVGLQQTGGPHTS